MEQLKVRKKHTIIYNVVIYLCLSFFFLYLQHAYRHHLSPFSTVYMKKGLELFWYIALPLFVSACLVWKHHKHSMVMYKFSIFLVSFKVVEGLFIEFNKIIVIALFFYITISYFLYQLLNHYMGLSSINANYDSTDLFEPLLKKIHCKVEVNGETFNGYLSNWDSEGCFVKLDEPRAIPHHVALRVFFSDREFSQNGEVVASTVDSSGVGIRFERSIKELDVFNWSEFMEIVHELGFEPKRLR